MATVNVVNFYHHTIINFSLMIRTFKIYSFGRVVYSSLLDFKMYSTLLTTVTMLHIIFSWLICFRTRSCNFWLHQFLTVAFLVAQTVKGLPAMWAIPGSGSSPGEGNGNPFQYSCLENPMDGGTWLTTVHRVAKSRTRLSDFTFTSFSPPGVEHLIVLVESDWTFPSPTSSLDSGLNNTRSCRAINVNWHRSCPFQTEEVNRWFMICA